MKKSVLFLAAFVCFVMQSVTAFADDRIIPASQLPVEAINFLNATFPGQNITYAKVDKEFSKTKYEARLDNGVEVDFDKKGNWDKVDCKTEAVPAHLVPEHIANFVNTTHPGTMIVKIDKERYGYKIELSNDLELKFNKKGELFDIDD